jgi:hypothetical protein
MVACTSGARPCLYHVPLSSGQKYNVPLNQVYKYVFFNLDYYKGHQIFKIKNLILLCLEKYLSAIIRVTVCHAWYMCHMLNTTGLYYYGQWE